MNYSTGLKLLINDFSFFDYQHSLFSYFDKLRNWWYQKQPLEDNLVDFMFFMTCQKTSYLWIMFYDINSNISTYWRLCSVTYMKVITNRIKLPWVSTYKGDLQDMSLNIIHRSDRTHIHHSVLHVDMRQWVMNCINHNLQWHFR